MALRSPLSELEQAIMNIIWERDSATAADIVESLTVLKRPLKDSTVRTVLGRLEDKGYLRHTVEGRTFFYKSCEKKNKIAVTAIKQILDRFCHGSVESLLTGMVDGDVIDPKDLQQIADRLAHGRSLQPKKIQTGRK